MPHRPPALSVAGPAGFAVVHHTVLLCAASVAVVVCLAVVAAPAHASSPALSREPAPARAARPAADVRQTYEPSNRQLANPDRGFYRYTETHALADGSGWQALDVATLEAWRTQEQVTLAYRIFYLERFADGAPLEQGLLEGVRADLAAARTAGVRLVVRFAYSADTAADAPAAAVVRHIRQLAPVLNAERDVIAVLQAGFVGRWGEWYYSEHFASDPERPWLLSEADWAARGEVLRTLLAETDPQLAVQVRYAEIARRLLADQPGATRARVGLHDDCFVGSADDMGTFRDPGDRSWLADVSRSSPVGGETCAVHEPRSLWSTAQTELVDYHYSFLNRDYHPDVLASWGSAALAQVQQRLGYRIRLVEATLPAAVDPGSPLRVRLELTNDGYAAPFRHRPAYLVLAGSDETHALELPLDLRDVRPGETTSVTTEVLAPSAAGRYAVSLAFPDPSPRLAERPAFAVRLANVGVWNPVTGRNFLRHSVTVG